MALLVRGFRPPRLAQQVNFLARRLSTASTVLADDLYDVIIVGGGIAGLAMATSLGVPPFVHPRADVASFDLGQQLKIALVERNALKSETLSGPPRNRCSSLTPSSVKLLQGK
jgi:hypothetical protein